MTSLHEIQNFILASYLENMLDEEEFLLLYNANAPSNPNFQFSQVDADGQQVKFNLDNFNDDECNSYFRFQKRDIFNLKEVLLIPEKIKLENGSWAPGIEVLCLTLQRYAYPCRFGDLVKDYHHPVPKLCLMFKWMTNYIYSNFNHLVSSLDQAWLSPQNLKNFADVVYGKGASLSNCWGFIDGTVRPICRPSKHQKVVYNGHKRIHALKYQAVTTPNGLVAHFFGPVEGRRHDAFLLRESGLLDELENKSFDPAGNTLCLYGDPAYPLRAHLQAPFPTPNITKPQEEFNSAMSKVRIAVEWSFGEIINNFKFTDYKKSQKVLLSACGKMYIVSCILTNAHTCVYKNNISNYFGLNPPTLDEYFM